jgi:hypothetical protein
MPQLTHLWSVMQMNALSRQTSILNAMKHSGVGELWPKNTYVIMFFAGKVSEYRVLACDWPRIRMCDPSFVPIATVCSF